MNKVVIKILQRSVVSQTVLGGLPTRHPLLQISYKLIGNTQSYCNNKQTYFMAHV